MAEGMVPFERMSESFEVESSRLRAKGTRTGKIYKMGDSVRVRILKADMEKKQIEIEQEAWRTVNAMFEEKEQKYQKELAEKDQALNEKDQEVIALKKKMEELKKRLGE